MDKYVCSDGDRLDTVAFKCYETLSNFSDVLEANPHLLGLDTLNSGDIVYLPQYIKKADVEEVSLWN